MMAGIELNTAQVMRMFEGGMRDAEIAQALGVTREAIRQRRKRLGVPAVCRGVYDKNFTAAPAKARTKAPVLKAPDPWVDMSGNKPVANKHAPEMVKADGFHGIAFLRGEKVDKAVVIGMKRVKCQWLAARVWVKA
jgi:hypothetical protein